MPPPRDNIDCDFEDDFCGYTQDLDTDYGDWTRDQGYGNSFRTTGPDVDHTLGTTLGEYNERDPKDFQELNSRAFSLPFVSLYSPFAIES